MKHLLALNGITATNIRKVKVILPNVTGEPKQLKGKKVKNKVARIKI